MSLEAAPQVAIHEVKWRVDGKPIQDKNNNSKHRCRFVPYIDATIVAKLLDEWVGPDNWKDTYETIDLAGTAALYCHLSVRVENEWVAKVDVGVASNFQAQKGMVSDAFKRAACLKWGVGRNVYELPTLWATCRVDPKGNAWPNDNTMVEIHKQLSKQGYGKGDPPRPESAPVVEPEPAEDVLPEWLETLREAHGDEKVVHAAERIRVLHGTGSEIKGLHGCINAPAHIQQEIEQLLSTGELPTVEPAPDWSGTGGEAATPVSADAPSQPSLGGDPAADSPAEPDTSLDDRDRLYSMVDEALAGSIILFSDVARAAAKVCVDEKVTPPANRAGIKDLPASVLKIVVEKLSLQQRLGVSV